MDESIEARVKEYEMERDTEGFILGKLMHIMSEEEDDFEEAVDSGTMTSAGEMRHRKTMNMIGNLMLAICRKEV